MLLGRGSQTILAAERGVGLEGQSFLGWLLCWSIFGFSFGRAVLSRSFLDWFFREDISKAHCNRIGGVSSTQPQCATQQGTHTHTRQETGSTRVPGLLFLPLECLLRQTALRINLTSKHHGWRAWVHKALG